MAKTDIDARTRSADSPLAFQKGVGKKRLKVKFGNVTVTGDKPAADTVRMNVERSSESLKRLREKLAKPGVALRAKKDVPLFSVSEDEPGVFIRRLNGRTERGLLVDGAFQVIE